MLYNPPLRDSAALNQAFSGAFLGGDIAEIRNLFSGFQRYLYQGATVAN
ncbi:MAG: hypothetical protein HY935_02565 [Nitrosomonadales bacterium]|nr:hypothetical protein [Nitrosomonadales bacterium]